MKNQEQALGTVDCDPKAKMRKKKKPKTVFKMGKEKIQPLQVLDQIKQNKYFDHEYNKNNS